VSRPRVLLVHGSVVNGDATWAAQRPLAERFELVVPNRRGFPPGPDVERVDFEEEAVWLERYLEPGTHLVGHSYGGSMAARDAERGRLDHGQRPHELGPREPEAFLRGFLEAVGTTVPPGTLSPALLQGARTLLVERYPWEADVPLAELAGARFPKLVVSGAHSAAFDAVCDVLERELPAKRAVLPGAGHSVQRLGGPFNALLTAFVEQAERG